MTEPIGYNEWGVNLLEHPPDSGKLRPVIDGVEYSTSCIENLQWGARPRGGLLDSAGGTSVHQQVWVRAQQPLNASRRLSSFLVSAVAQEIWEQWLSLQGRVVTFYVGWYEEDRWSILAADGAQEVWQLSREVAWGNVTGVTSTTHPGAADIDGTAQTIDYAPTPTDPLVAGNVYLLDRDNSGGEPDAIQSRKVSDIGGEYLRFRYPAIHRLRIDDVGYTVRRANDLVWNVSVRELLPGTYTAIAPGPDIILDPAAL